MGHIVFIRNVDPEVFRLFQEAAGARRLFHREYLERLVALHRNLREQADAGNTEIQAQLEGLGLESVAQ